MRDDKYEKIIMKTREEVKAHFREITTTLSFGATHIKPEGYFVSFILATEKELQEAKKNGLTSRINDYYKERMKANGYPTGAIKDCTFASQEDCDKNYNGNWFYYYK